MTQKTLAQDALAKAEAAHHEAARPGEQAVLVLPTAKAAPQERSVVRDMAHQYGMEQAAFQATVMATCFPQKKEDQPTPAEFAAFILIAKTYGLNPILKEIYGFKDRKGGIVPIVSIDGWCNLINSNPQADGISFTDTVDAKGELISVTCRIMRKDRKHPIEVTEYLKECRRGTDPWKQYPFRMLRHKALIQCARYAFGFAGIYDPDEGERILGNGPVIEHDNAPRIEHNTETLPDPMADVVVPAPAAQRQEPEKAVAAEIVEGSPQIPIEGVIGAEAGKNGIPTFLDRTQSTGETKPEVSGTDQPMPDPAEELMAFVMWADGKLASFGDGDGEAANDWWNATVEPAIKPLSANHQESVLGIWRKHEPRLVP